PRAGGGDSSFAAESHYVAAGANERGAGPIRARGGRARRLLRRRGHVRVSQIHLPERAVRAVDAGGSHRDEEGLPDRRVAEPLLLPPAVENLPRGVAGPAAI